MKPLPDVALRDADRYADEQGRIAAHEEYLDALVETMLDDVDEVDATVRFSESGVLARVFAELAVRLRQTPRGQLPPDVSAAWSVAETYLKLLAREEAECRMRDGDL